MVDVVILVEISFWIVSGTAAAFSAYTAFQVRKGNELTRRATEQWSRTLVQPRIFVYGSKKGVRERIGLGPGGLTKTQITKGGLVVENLGLGPALKGILFVIDHQGIQIPIRRLGEDYTFLRIPAGQVYYFPSYDSPELEQYVTDRNKIQIQVKYSDINGVQYQLPSEEQNIELFPQ